MTTFGNETSPLRPSQLAGLVSCSWKAVYQAMEHVRDESGPSADLGSAVHFAVAAYHRKEADAVARMREAAAAFPLADLDEAERIFGRYVADPRNSQAEVVAIEFPITVRLDPKYLDGPPIVIEGTLDQVRRVGDTFEVWDLKTGNRDGLYMQQHYAMQLAAYTLGAAATFAPVVPGGYLRTKGYFTRGAVLPSPQGVFVPACIPDPDALLDAVRWSVCAIRAGYVIASPGDHCGFCPLQGIEFCIPKLRQLS